MTSTPNHLPARPLTTTGKGGAQYVFANHAPAEWLVASIPGATEAREAWLAENAVGADLARQHSASGRALVALRASDPRASELEEAERAHKELGLAIDAQARKALMALRRFDALAYTGLGTQAEYKAKAAEHTLAKHAEAVAAWEILKAALTEREEAHSAAGSPGRSWKNMAPISHRSLSAVLGAVAPALEAFDVLALERTADGERIPSAEERAAAAEKAAQELSAKAARAVRARSAREGR